MIAAGYGGAQTEPWCCSRSSGRQLEHGPEGEAERVPERPEDGRAAAAGTAERGDESSEDPEDEEAHPRGGDVTRARLTRADATPISAIQMPTAPPCRIMLAKGSNALPSPPALKPHASRSLAHATTPGDTR